MAIESPFVTADAVQATEFPHLVQKYHVNGVPKIVVNDRVEFQGALPEPRFLEHVLKAVDGKR